VLFHAGDISILVRPMTQGKGSAGVYFITTGSARPMVSARANRLALEPLVRGAWTLVRLPQSRHQATVAPRSVIIVQLRITRPDESAVLTFQGMCPAVIAVADVRRGPLVGYSPATSASSDTACSSETPPSSASFAEIIDDSANGVRTPTAARPLVSSFPMRSRSESLSPSPL